jgi:hypothetical protein
MVLMCWPRLEQNALFNLAEALGMKKLYLLPTN